MVAVGALRFAGRAWRCGAAGSAGGWPGDWSARRRWRRRCACAVEGLSPTARRPASSVPVPWAMSRVARQVSDVLPGLRSARVSRPVRAVCCQPVAGASAPRQGSARVRVCGMRGWIGWFGFPGAAGCEGLRWAPARAPMKIDIVTNITWTGKDVQWDLAPFDRREGPELTACDRWSAAVHSDGSCYRRLGWRAAITVQTAAATVVGGEPTFGDTPALTGHCARRRRINRASFAMSCTMSLADCIFDTRPTLWPAHRDRASMSPSASVPGV